MARATFEGWLPEAWDSTVITKVNQTSAVEAFAGRVPMPTDTKKVPRAGDVDIEVVAKGAAYGEDVNPNDLVLLDAQKLGKVVRFAEEDIDDTAGFIDIVDQKKTAWGLSYAKYLDNACLGTTAAVGTGVPFTSIYRALTQANAATSYAANANLLQTVAATPATYDQLSQVIGKLETGDYFDESDVVVIAHPSFKGAFRGIKDGSGRPIFQEGTGGGADQLFGYAVRYSLGARTSATASKSPTGNPLLIAGSKSLMILGVRSGPESVLIDGRDGASALTDETLLKMRARRAFAVGHETGFSVLEQR